MKRSLASDGNLVLSDLNNKEIIKVFEQCYPDNLLIKDEILHNKITGICF